MSTNVVNQSAPPGLPYTDAEIAESINNIPNMPGQLQAEGFFPDKPSASQYVAISSINGTLSALPVTGNGPPTVKKHGNANVRYIKIPTIKHQDDVLAEDIRGWLDIARASGTGQPETFAGLFNDRMSDFKDNFTLTRELMRMSCLKGIVIDGAGDEVINLYTAFGIDQKQVYFDFADDDADIQGACDQIIMLITQDLSDEVMTNVQARVSRSFFNKLIEHPKVEKYWLQAEQALQLANAIRNVDGNYRPRRLTVFNIEFIEYNAVVPMWGGEVDPIIAADTGHAYPAGTRKTHKSFVAPPDDIRVLNGQPFDAKNPIYITTEDMKHGAGVEILGRMNWVPLWTRPKLLVTLNAGAGSSTEAADGQ